MILLQTVVVADQPLESGALERDYADAPARSWEVAVQGDDEADVCTFALAPLPNFIHDPEDDASDQDGSVAPVRVESPDSPPAATPFSDPPVVAAAGQLAAAPSQEALPNKSGKADAFKMVNFDFEIWGLFLPDLV